MPSKGELGVILLKILNGIHHVGPSQGTLNNSGSVTTEVSGEDV